MTHVVYGLRIIGEFEVRYVGQTKYTPQHRLQFLAWEARHAGIGRNVHKWIHDHRGTIEAFVIARCDGEAEARRVERETVVLCVAIGCRLLNRQLMPAGTKIAA